MEQIKKMKALGTREINLEQDISLINRHSIKELKPEDVFAFTVVLCDNEVDRDFERFDDSSLEKMAPLFVGKTGIFNHSWDATDQIARIYKTVIESPGEKNSLGEPLKQLVGFAYILRGERTDWAIKNIEGGILKEVSVGFSVSTSECSVCGTSMHWCECDEGHMKGRDYDGKLCYGLLKDPTDAYEFSFVAVPAQRGAGVRKGFSEGDLTSQWNAFIGAWDGVEIPLQLGEKFILDLKKHMTHDEERKKRQEILANNKKFMKESE